jgi:hypothetical protein
MSERITGEEVNFLRRYRLDPNIPQVENLFNHFAAGESRLNLSRLWLLVQYQSFRPQVDFSTAARSLKEQFKRENTVTGTYWSPPNRQQVLGRMRELKVEEFLDLWRVIETEMGISVFDQAAFSAPQELLKGTNQYFVSLTGAQLRLKEPEWLALCNLPKSSNGNIVIDTLPRSLSAELQKVESITNLHEEIPF